MSDTPELKPCPWEPGEGGHHAATDAWGDTDRWSAAVRCVICGAQGPITRRHATREGAITAAIAAWNSWGEKDE